MLSSRVKKASWRGCFNRCLKRGIEIIKMNREVNPDSVGKEPGKYNGTASLGVRSELDTCRRVAARELKVGCVHPRSLSFTLKAVIIQMSLISKEIGRIWTCISEGSCGSSLESEWECGVEADGRRVNGCGQTGKMTHAGNEEGRSLGRLPRPGLNLLDCLLLAF